MESLLLVMLAVILLLLVGIALLLTRRGAESRALEEKLNRVQLGLATLQAHADARYSQTQTLAEKLHNMQMGLTELQAYTHARAELEQQTAESVRRLEAIIAGTHSKGAAGEQILEAVFARLPQAWQVRNFHLGNKVVEFGLRLPNSLILPIDSKWAATPLLEQYRATEEPGERQRLKAHIQRVVLRKAKEVKKYIDPTLTTPFGVVVVPDAVYELCAGIQAEVFQLHVALVSYSMFAPYLLLVFQTVLKASYSVDLQKLEAYLDHVRESLDALQNELEGRFSDSLIRLGNSRDEMRVHLGRIRGGLAGVQVSATALRTPEGDPRPLRQSAALASSRQGRPPLPR